MNTADLANERVFAEIKRLCLLGLDPTTLRQRVTERLSRAVPFESYVAFTRTYGHAPSVGHVPPQRFEEWIDEVAADPVFLVCR
jgi:hypothetical protein